MEIHLQLPIASETAFAWEASPFGWMDRWMDGRTDGWMDGWMDGCHLPLGEALLGPNQQFMFI